MGRYTITMPAELWADIQQAAAQAGAERGKPMSVSEWMRSAAIAKIGGK